LARLAIVAGWNVKSRELIKHLPTTLLGIQLKYFLAGYSQMSNHNWFEAGKLFHKAWDIKVDSALSRKSKFYSTVAHSLSQGRKKLPGGLVLAGLGINPPYTATAGDLQRLAGCKVIFNNVMGDEMFEFLRILCRDVRPVAYHQDGDEARITSEIFTTHSKSNSTAFVTRGNAIVYGPLGSMMLDKARKMKLDVHCQPGVSSSDYFLSSQGFSAQGVAVIDMAELVLSKKINTSIATIIFWDLSAGEAAHKSAANALIALFGFKQRCLIYDHTVCQVPLEQTLNDLLCMYRKLSASAIVLLKPSQ
jgi:precorrin-6B methylase 1